MARNPLRADRLDTILEEVARLDLEGARRRWQELYCSPAPPTLRRPLLQAAIAYKLQERALGGLRPATRRLLRRVAEEADRHRDLGAAGGRPQEAADDRPRTRGAKPSSARIPATNSPARIKPGTRLLRTWQGTTHEVMVVENGVTYRGQPYRSLSEVARLITGQRWSGPRFFGLRGRPSHVET